MLIIMLSKIEPFCEVLGDIAELLACITKYNERNTPINFILGNTSYHFQILRNFVITFLCHETFNVWILVTRATTFY